jgi:hypothetical protein
MKTPLTLLISLLLTSTAFGTDYVVSGKGIRVKTLVEMTPIKKEFRDFDAVVMDLTPAQVKRYRAKGYRVEPSQQGAQDGGLNRL